MSDSPELTLEERLLSRRKPIGFEEILCLVIDDALPPGMTAYYEHRLRGTPQRADILIRKDDDFDPASIELLPALFSRLHSHNILELKGGTHSADLLDPTTLLGYGCQHQVNEWRAEVKRRARLDDRAEPLEPLTPVSVKLIFILPHMVERARQGLQLRHGTLALAEPGVWEGTMGGFPLLVLETDVLWRQTPGHRLLFLNTLRGATDSEVRKEMTAEEERVYNRLSQFFEEGLMSLEEDLMKSVTEKINERWEKALQRGYKKMTIAQRLDGIPPEELIEHIPVEKRLEGIPAEQRLEGIPADTLLSAVPAEKRLEGIPAEKLVEALKSSPLAHVLPAEWLQLLQNFTPPTPSPA